MFEQKNEQKRQKKACLCSYTCYIALLQKKFILQKIVLRKKSHPLVSYFFPLSLKSTGNLSDPLQKKSTNYIQFFTREYPPLS